MAPPSLLILMLIHLAFHPLFHLFKSLFEFSAGQVNRDHHPENEDQGEINEDAIYYIAHGTKITSLVPGLPILGLSLPKF